MVNRSKEAIIQAYEKGYRVIDGIVYYKGRKRKAISRNNGYDAFSLRMYDKKSYTVPIHRMVAYQKYGNKIFDIKIEIRHLNSDCLNNYEHNIGIGSKSENNQDKSPEVRMRASLIGTSFVKKHNHEEIIKMKNNGLTYEQIMEKLNIKSKGTISFIINKSIQSKT